MQDFLLFKLLYFGFVFIGVHDYELSRSLKRRFEDVFGGLKINNEESCSGWS